MVLKVQKNNKLVDLPDNEAQDLSTIGKSLKLAKLLKLAHSFSDTEKKMEYNINERWIMEAALIECVAILGS